VRYGIDLVNFGAFADPRRVVEAATLAEESGWDGLFLWDHLAYVWGPPSCDPWVALTAAACATDRIRLGTAVSPLARYKPHLLAGALATVDQLSGGRVVLGVGVGGAPEEFAAFGEPDDDMTRAALVDEGLGVMEALWSGREVHHEGTAFTVNGVRLATLPYQRPRVPVWVGGDSAPALRRAARWDGWVAPSLDDAGEVRMTTSPERLAEQVQALLAAREEDSPLDVAVLGYSDAGDAEPAEAYAAAGATWWLETLHEMRAPVEALFDRIRAGPAGG
jgi:alkanesulfonate monooxygenase SsuD/methylene tetrahydromethanopterin reductase-like flavin-dependent oxidoreductase (luciferase family)